jgi:transposase-like protein
VLEEVKIWQASPLEEVYPIVSLDAPMVKMRDNGHIQNKAIYVVLGVILERPLGEGFDLSLISRGQSSRLLSHFRYSFVF